MFYIPFRVFDQIFCYGMALACSLLVTMYVSTVEDLPKTPLQAPAWGSEKPALLTQAAALLAQKLGTGSSLRLRKATGSSLGFMPPA